MALAYVFFLARRYDLYFIHCRALRLRALIMFGLIFVPLPFQYRSETRDRIPC